MSKAMTSARHMAVNRYVQKIAELMNLSHYTITVDKAYATDEVFAESLPRLNGASMSVSFSERFFNESIKEQRNTVCHELLHAHVDPLWQHVIGGTTIRDLTGRPAFAVFEESGTNLMERMVDQIANGWSNSLPLPFRFPR